MRATFFVPTQRGSNAAESRSSLQKSLRASYDTTPSTPMMRLRCHAVTLFAMIVIWLAAQPALATPQPGYTKVLISHLFIQPNASAPPQPMGSNVIELLQQTLSGLFIHPNANAPAGIAEIVGDDGTILADYDSFTLASVLQASIDRIEARAAAAGTGMSTHD